MSDFLAQMATASMARASAVRRDGVPGGPDRPRATLSLDGFGVIAELKDRSPAEGGLANETLSRVERARAYVAGGATAISVLTEPERFAGSLAHLAEVADAVAGRGVPVMRKDFLVETVQVDEARAAGASGILLIAALLDDAQLTTMLDAAFGQELFVLLESFDETDLERSTALLAATAFESAAADGRLLFGVNTRNLRTLAVDPDRLARFAPLLPGGVACVAESGQRTAADARQAARMGYRLSLVGTALMRAADPAALIADMVAAGRAA